MCQYWRLNRQLVTILSFAIPCYRPRVAEDPIQQAWSRVESAWDDDENHRRFLSLCVAFDRLPEAGQRYRAVRENDPTRKDEAQRRIDELIVIATQKLRETGTDKFQPRDTKRRLGIYTFVVMSLLVIIAIWLMLRGYP